MKRVNVLILFILPALLLFLAFTLKKEIAFYFLTGVDPEYCYLFNGLNVAHLQFPWHVDHPGSTLQLLSAIVIRIVHFFHNQGTLDEDVFRNPDLFLFSINTTICLIHTSILFVIGYIVYRNSKNIWLSVFFQLTPFMSYTVLSLLNRVIVEQLFISIILCLAIVVFLFINNQKNNGEKILDKYLILFALIVGLGIATKITFAPLAVIPFILLPGIKKKMIFSFLSLFLFAVFAFFIFNRWGYYTHWVRNLFSHSGQYGSGPSNIIDSSSFIINIKSIFSTDVFFPIIFIVLFISCLFYFIPFLKVKRKNDLYFKGLLGVTLAMIFMIIIVAKQFKYFYLTPALLLMILGLYFVIIIYSRPFPILKKKIIIIPALIIFGFCGYYFEVKKIFDYHTSNVNRNTPYLQTLNIIQEKNSNIPVLILSNYYGAPYKEYSLFFGDSWCGEKMKSWYNVTLIKLYPTIYFYHNWNNLFNWWENSFSFIDLLKKHKNIILYSGDPELENSLDSKLHGINRQLDTKFTKTFFNEITREVIYEVSYNSLLADTNKIFICNAELLDSTKNNFVNINEQFFSNGNTQSNEKAKSGVSSSKLTKELPYGMTSILSEVKTGEHYIISVWRYDNKNENAGIVVSAFDSEIFYKFQNISEKIDGEWAKIQLDIVIPENMNYKDIKIYCWNRSAELPAYFDDLCIEKIN